LRIIFANVLDKIRNVCYVFYWIGISLSLAERRWEDGKLSLFEPLAHNLPREPGQGSDFFYAQPIEKAGFGKENERK
jgi:hypothetical protein